jgi:hypothetical protein
MAGQWFAILPAPAHKYWALREWVFMIFAPISANYFFVQEEHACERKKAPLAINLSQAPPQHFFLYRQPFCHAKAQASAIPRPSSSTRLQKAEAGSPSCLCIDTALILPAGASFYTFAGI